LENPYHTFFDPGQYTITLTTSGPGGDGTETKTGYITVENDEYLANCERYKSIDILFAGQDHQNPYMDVTLSALVVGPSGQSFTIEGFWIGNNGYKFRIAPTEAGMWTYTTISNDNRLNDIEGQIDCAYADHPGFLKTDGYHFVYENGTPFLRMGDTCWRGFRSKNAPYETHFKPYIDARAEQGFNMIYSVVHTVYDSTVNEGGPLWPEDYDLDELQPGFFDYVDKRIRYMNRKGIISGILFAWAQTFDDFTQAQFERFVRYIVARYAAWDVLWVISGEYNETMTPSDYDYFGSLVEQYDPYQHPISIHPSGDTSNSQDYNTFSDWLDYIMQQMDGPVNVLSQNIIDDYIYDLPVCNDEFGYEGPTDPADPFYYPNNRSPDDIRKSAWTIIASGGHFTYGNIYTYTGKERVIHLDQLYSLGAEYINILADIIREKIPFHEMQPDPTRVGEGAYCLAKETDSFLVYLPDTTTFQIDLSTLSGYFKIRWIDPKTGNEFDGGYTQGGGIRELNSSFTDDTIVLLQAQDVLRHKLSLYLEGAFKQSTGNMHTTLRDDNVLPSESPYSLAPKTVARLPENVTDWILIKMLDGKNGTAVASQSVLLRNDGMIVSDNGDTSLVFWPELSPGSYYLSAEHRNHLRLFTADSVVLNAEDCPHIDFISDSTVTSNIKNIDKVSAGQWASRSGDADQNGYITTMDYTLWYDKNRINAMGYLSSDFNLDGYINEKDFLLWLKNAIVGAP
jgi:PKD repeat protein